MMNKHSIVKVMVRLGKRIKYEDVKSYVENRGFTLLSDKYVNNSTKLKMTCPNGHYVESAWNSFSQTKNGCRECTGTKKYTLDEVKVFFLERGCILLSEIYSNANDSLDYKCKCGKITSSSLNKFMKNKQGCRFCSQKPKGFVYKEYSREDLTNEFWRYFKEFGNYPRTTDLTDANGFPSINLYYKEFGNYTYFLKEVVCVLGENDWYKCDENILYKHYRYGDKKIIMDNLLVKRNWEAVCNKARTMGLNREIHSTGKFFNKTKLIKNFWDYYKKHKKYPLGKDFNDDKDSPSIFTVVRYFGSWENYLKEVGVVRSSGFKGWYLYEDKILKKYYPINQLEKIQSILPGRNIASIKDRANYLKLYVSKEVRYSLKYKDNEEVKSTLITEAKCFYEKNGRSPFKYELSYPKKAVDDNWASYNHFLEEANLPIFRKSNPIKTKNQAVKLLQKLAYELERNPTVYDLAEYGVRDSYFKNNFGSYRQGLYEAGLLNKNQFDYESRLKDSIKLYENLYDLLGRPPSFTESKKAASENRLYHPFVLMDKLDLKSYVELCEFLFGSSNRIKYDIDEMTHQIIQLKNKLGRPPLAKELDENGLPSRDAYRRTFGVRYYNDVIRQLGWEPYGHDPKYKSDEELLKDYMSLYDKLGRIPFGDDINEQDCMCSSETYKKRFGSLANVCQLLNLNYNELIIESKMGSGTSCFDKNGDFCRSIPEMQITNIFIDNELKFLKEYGYHNINVGDKRRFDWFIEDNEMYVEYFGLYDESRLNSSCRVGIYSRKVLDKISFCEQHDVKMVALFKEDTKNNFKGLLKKFNDQGVAMEIFLQNN